VKTLPGALTQLALDSSPRLLRTALVNAYGLQLGKQRFRPPFAACRDWLEQTQWWAPHEIESFQNARLARIVAVARLRVPYYRSLEVTDAVDPGPCSKSDLSAFPLLTKETLRRSAPALMSETATHRRPVRERSSGTTGQQLEFMLPRLLAHSLNYALLYRFYSWAGVQVGDRRVTLGGRFLSSRPPYWVYNRAEDQLLLGVAHLHEGTVDGYIGRMRSFAPVFVVGHPSATAFIAERLRQRRETMPVRAVFTTGETLDPTQREDIEHAFRCAVFESYGQAESAVAAFECEEHRGFHEAVELGITELLPQSGELSAVVGTSLWNDVMPFIRYKTDDLVETADSSRCPCGRGLPIRFRRVVGRDDDVLRTPEGRTVIPVAVRMLVKPHLLPFETYQVQQLDRRSYRVLLAGGGGRRPLLTPARERSMHAALAEVLGHDARLSIDPVEGIGTAGLKARTVVNLSD
jgi:phenylacetate-CoA ligase